MGSSDQGGDVNLTTTATGGDIGALSPGPGIPGLFTLMIELADITPTVWRRVTIPGDVTLDGVHEVFQAVMGWQGEYVHRFQPGPEQEFGQVYASSPADRMSSATAENVVRLDQLLRTPGDMFSYLYADDPWVARGALESVSRLTSVNRDPVCVAGAGAGPITDVGGPIRHEGVAAWIRAGCPENDVPGLWGTAERLHRWLPAGYHPDAFRVEEMTAALGCLRYTYRDFVGMPYQAEQYLRGALEDEDQSAFIGAVVSIVGPLGMTWFAHRLGLTLDVLEEQLSHRELRREKTVEKIIVWLTID